VRSRRRNQRRAITRRLSALLPRLSGRTGRLAVGVNTLALLLTVLFGAGLVHLLAYHLPLDALASQLWLQTTVTLLVSCPLTVPVGIVAISALAALLLVRRETRRLSVFYAQLSLALAPRQPDVSTGDEPQSRSPGRLLVLLLGVLVLQVAALSLYEQFLPMRMTMVMQGVSMQMPMVPLLPLAPLHLIVAVLLGCLLWRIERRLVRLRIAIALTLRLLARSRLRPLPMPAGPAHRTRAWAGASLFARPPPLTL
jgi:hypothetical protein